MSRSSVSTKHTVETIFKGDASNQLNDVAVSDNGLVFVADRHRLSWLLLYGLHLAMDWVESGT
jgi:hypothetical protein